MQEYYEETTQAVVIRQEAARALATGNTRLWTQLLRVHERITKHNPKTCAVHVSFAIDDPAGVFGYGYDVEYCLTNSKPFFARPKREKLMTGAVLLKLHGWTDGSWLRAKEFVRTVDGWRLIYDETEE